MSTVTATTPDQIPIEHTPAYYVAFGERLAKLETHWDDASGSFATRADLKSLETRLVIWFSGAVLAVLIGFFSAFFSLQSNVRADIREIRSEVRSEIKDVRAEISTVRSELKAEIQEMRAETREVRAEIKTISEQIAALTTIIQMQNAKKAND